MADIRADDRRLTTEDRRLDRRSNLKAAITRLRSDLANPERLSFFCTSNTLAGNPGYPVHLWQLASLMGD